MSAGFALVMMPEYQYDSFFYSPSLPDDHCNATYPGNICWNGGDNPDAAWLRALFSALRRGEGTLGAINYDRMALIGYSVGAQMVSRSMNDFPSQRTDSGASFPRVRAAVLASGGSMYCYAYTSKRPPRSYGRCFRRAKSEPGLRRHFEDRIGCCPRNFTERAFDTGKLPWAEHPPVLLMQTLCDSKILRCPSLYIFNTDFFRTY